ncbi:cytochrome P450 [Streptomyces sp. NPDC053560]|uniref:cytochrome P450 n=1 Tax=Streptomyces sp. NPDC053560 TaxID=3365711 RepID=UPI0037D5C9C4
MKTSSAIPTAPGALPLIGHILPLLRAPLAFLTSLPALGELVRIRVGPLAIVLICDPELTRQVLLDDRTFDKGGPVFDRVREVMGDGLGTCSHGAHRRLRRLTQPAFHPDRLPGYAQAMAVCIDEVTTSWRSGQIVDVPREMGTITARATAATLFSGELPAERLSQIVDDVTTIFDSFYQRMFKLPPLDKLPTPGNRAWSRARSRLRHTLIEIIAERRADGSDHGDLLSALLASHDQEDRGRGLTDAEVIDTVTTFFLAGTETTAGTLAWALDFLGRHPHIQQRLYAEADAVAGGAPSGYADMDQLKLTGRVITETLRLRPPGWLLTRAVSADTHLGGHLLSAGTTVAYSPYIIHHRADLFDAAETFDPDRWDPARLLPPRQNLIPFSTGPRKCIGDTFAMAEATLALATITARWHLQQLPHHNTRPALGLALRPRALPMRAIRRTAAGTPDRKSPSSSP